MKMFKKPFIVKTALLACALSSAAAGAYVPSNIGYVPVNSTNSVVKVDLLHQKILNKITGVGSHPVVVRALPDASKIYVDNFGQDTATIGVIDAATNKVIKLIPTHGSPFASIQLSPDGHYLFVPTEFAKLDVIDTRTDQVVRSFQLPGLPFGIEVSSDGSQFFVNFSGDTIGAFDSVTGKSVRPTISLQGIGAGWTGMSPDGKTLYSANITSGDVSFLDVVNWRVTKVVKVGTGSQPISLTATPDGKQLYVCNSGTRNISIIDLATSKVIKVLQYTTVPISVGFSPDSKLAYLSDLGASSYVYPDGSLVGTAFFGMTNTLPSYIRTFSTVTYQPVGKPISTDTGAIYGVYF